MEAFSELMLSLIKNSDLSKIKKIELNKIKGMIDSFSIKEEKFIDQTYYVNLGVSFNKKKIFNYLEKKGIFPSQIIKENFLFIPIIINENDSTLNIFSNNLVYKNWNKINKKYHSINYIIPAEDLEDLSTIKKNYNFIEKYDFKEIIEKYFLKNSIIALIFKNNEEVRVLSKIITKDKIVIKNDTFQDFDLSNNDKIEILIDKLKSTYEDAWKDQNQINTSIKLQLIIRLNNDDAKKLSEFENVLDQFDLISYYSIKRFNKDHIFYQIIFNGTSINFINMMKDRNYIFDTQKKIWILK